TYRAAVSFIPRDLVRQYILECTIAAVSAHLESNPNEVVRRFMEHSEMRFRLSYVLGHVGNLSSETEELEDDDAEKDQTEESEITSQEQHKCAERLGQFLERIRDIASSSKQAIANELEIDLSQ